MANSTSSGSGTVTNTGDYIYVANANPSEASIAALSVSSTGTLTAISGSPYSLTFIPTALAVTPNNNFLYVGGTSGIYAYSIGTAGTLTLISNAGASIPVASLAISPDGNYLFALQSNVVAGTNVSPTAYSSTLDEYQISSAGTLALITNPAYTTTSGTFTPEMVRVSPNQGYVAVALGTAGDIIFTLSNGALSSTVQILSESTISSDNALAFDSTSSYLYIARSGVSTGVAAYSVASGGIATQIGSTLGPTGNQPVAIVLDPTGKFAYVANRSDGTISGLSIAAGSVPVALTSSPYFSGTNVAALVGDNSSKYLVAISSGGSPDIDMYAFSASVNGGLNAQASSTSGTDPTLAVAAAATH